jgi:hypothetical protein
LVEANLLSIESGFVCLQGFAIFTDVGRKDIAKTNVISAIAQAPCGHTCQGLVRCQSKREGFPTSYQPSSDFAYLGVGR